ncbi:MAG: cytochrome c [Bdellovibrionales bacterium]|nr:cytochrome c [Bdellovibrionales bacterium]
MSLRIFPSSSAVFAALFSGLLLMSCEDKGKETPPQTEAEKLFERGRVVYMTQCTACHAQDPSQNGGVGPAIAGSSIELLRSKVLKNEYPAGYTPKRETKAMIALPHLEKDIEAIAAYLKR